MKENIKNMLPVLALFVMGGLAKGISKKCKRGEDDLWEGYFKGLSKMSYAMGYIALGLSTINTVTCECECK